MASIPAHAAHAAHHPTTDLKGPIARPYKCPYESCGKAFSRLEHRVRRPLPLPPLNAVPHAPHLSISPSSAPVASCFPPAFHSPVVARGSAHILLKALPMG